MTEKKNQNPDSVTVEDEPVAIVRELNEPNMKLMAKAFMNLYNKVGNRETPVAK